MIKFLRENRKISIILLILIGMEIFFFSEISETKSIGGTSITSIVYHFCVFFLFNTFLFFSLKKSKYFAIKVLIISIIYSILDEVHQSFTPGREAGIKDVLINNLGIVYSMIICLIYENKEKKNIQIKKYAPSLK